MIRLFLILSCLVIGAMSAYYAQPYVGGNSDIILIVVTVFTVFAGFLIAIITVIADPIMIREGSWRIAENSRDTVLTRLIAHIILFGLYLVTIGLLFVGVILEKALEFENVWKIWIERAYLFMGIISFLFTFALPKSLLNMQRSRYDAEIERRRNRDGIPKED